MLEEQAGAHVCTTESLCQLTVMAKSKNQDGRLADELAQKGTNIFWGRTQQWLPFTFWGRSHQWLPFSISVSTKNITGPNFRAQTLIFTQFRWGKN